MDRINFREFCVDNGLYYTDEGDHDRAVLTTQAAVEATADIIREDGVYYTIRDRLIPALSPKAAVKAATAAYIDELVSDRSRDVYYHDAAELARLRRLMTVLPRLDDETEREYEESIATLGGWQLAAPPYVTEPGVWDHDNRELLVSQAALDEGVLAGKTFALAIICDRDSDDDDDE